MRDTLLRSWLRVNSVAYVMPNLVPPVTTVSQAMEYKQRLQALDSTVNYLMTLYLHPSITPEVVREAKKAGIAGIKSYPAGLTTNSESGVTDYAQFFPVFAAMEEVGLVLVSVFPYWEGRVSRDTSQRNLGLPRSEVT